MQIKDNYLIRRSGLLLIIKIIIGILATLFIYRQFQSRGIDTFKINWPVSSVIIVSIVFIMMIVNWALEALKWKLLIDVIKKISFQESLEMVLAGLALNLIMPFTTGDALSRIGRFQDKIQATAALVINRGIMLAITMTYGLVSISYYSSQLWSYNPLIIVFVIVGLHVVWKLRNRLSRFFDYFKEITIGKLMTIVGLSLLRYFVFVTQFFLLLDLFLPQLSFCAKILGIGWVFFFRSMIPSLLGGVGVREASGLLFFSEVTEAQLVVLPIFLIWVINTVVPSSVGIVAVWRFKLHADN